MGRRRERRGPKEMPVLPTAVLTFCGIVFGRLGSFLTCFEERIHYSDQDCRADKEFMRSTVRVG